MHLQALLCRIQTRDAEIMSLALLLSSYFVYNSVGTIDEAALDRLSLMAHLSDRIAASSSKKDAQTNARELSFYFPTLHWVLRDCKMVSPLFLVNVNTHTLSLSSHTQSRWIWLMKVASAPSVRRNTWSWRCKHAARMWPRYVCVCVGFVFVSFHYARTQECSLCGCVGMVVIGC